MRISKKRINDASASVVQRPICWASPSSTSLAMYASQPVYEQQTTPVDQGDEKQPLLSSTPQVGVGWEANRKKETPSFSIQTSDVIANDYLHERAQAVQDIEAHMTELVGERKRLNGRGTFSSDCRR